MTTNENTSALRFGQTITVIRKRDGQEFTGLYLGRSVSAMGNILKIQRNGATRCFQMWAVEVAA